MGIQVIADLLRGPAVCKTLIGKQRALQTSTWYQIVMMLHGTYGSSSSRQVNTYTEANKGSGRHRRIYLGRMLHGKSSSNRSVMSCHGLAVPLGCHCLLVEKTMVAKTIYGKCLTLRKNHWQMLRRI